MARQTTNSTNSTATTDTNPASSSPQGIGLEAMQKELLENKEALNTAVTQGDFLAALKKVNKSVGQDDLAKYNDWMQEFGSA